MLDTPTPRPTSSARWGGSVLGMTSPNTSAPSAPPASFDDFTDIEGFLRLPRLTQVAQGRDGRVVAEIQRADEHGARLVSSLWELDPNGEHPARRLTGSEQGESAPHFAPDGSLLFTSARPDPSGGSDEDSAGLWRLPPTGEAELLARTPGGLTLLGVAEDGTMLAATEVLPGASLDQDADLRRDRSDARRTTIWHTGMPIRLWDHALGNAERHLVLVSPAGTIRDLTPDAGTVALTTASADLSPDARTVATTWTRRVRGGETRSDLVLLDVATGERRMLLEADEEIQPSGAWFSPDGTRLAVLAATHSSPTDTSYPRLSIHPVEGGDPVRVDLGDLTPAQVLWQQADTVLVAGDLHSSGAILAVDAATGAVRTCARDGVFSSLSVGPGGSIAALRSDVATPPRPVLISSDDAARELPAPGMLGTLPGTLEQVRTAVGEVEISGWLCVPHGADAENPAPVMLWVHGGPHASYNAWSWRWCPWLAVARGYAVLMPDPAMSTGYGDAGLNRGWPRRPEVVFAECEALLDRVLEDPRLDGGRTAMLGASFGGFMANWIAGHSDRFDAIVSHAGLWALEQQHRTTDAAAGKMRVHRHEDEDPEWYRASSPHRTVGAITTPMLISHGDRDYRVPISEALRMWWDLVSTWDGAAEEMPHRFLQLTDENHWVLRPSNALVWNRTVLDFCDQHVRGGEAPADTLAR